MCIFRGSVITKTDVKRRDRNILDELRRERKRKQKGIFIIYKACKAPSHSDGFVIHREWSGGGGF